ncbi:MAG: phosphoglycerate mutase (2,3-diphosphoglycerate-independent) [Candidatus Magasanikbacteria bacterium RIFCSPHIGHO2_01_FULL_41_23]|uniref:2,3-bisphosphoglycerate-independent phosphoglycerate mutase n=1 Tax=Candidatus Magasanikbacteria bacterium RIFCSPLOWO2_01_FULL_40_15 TaxID=1798686 RepID=A0A1F6N549_9BACT|nr:MAG: phosphoglycerate mutase (2,3-diphosphoglycerate-independent) [Candidatus Magasanikbacteria bacterium RIFCSPHIGHO2_01_FULL_41_23]OGH66771.1 MAG: phosphoglycerate mutase (2,3-diphosphoglycerate-independent) [Candidatus Magasanikbacteria bacterium RIFCSPHIGHO2_02_FULL_41_35]OGH74569.1 MAG: phosphoglycerate mutase (2,3-diphosphoglycerate-independent) [Candidatus Magasanikbacteria bacterium RIFCSPHIGHO2_12_FULL_41_16]OGH78858.1 MAG: phosphoglycerate mutase (2,3-diphosphoglycerate-independent)
MSTKKQIFPITPLVLIILDGFGLADPKISGNAITPKTAPHIFSYLKKYPNAKLKASGRDVGLFANQEGNSEAGHFNIGAGRIVKQDLVRISEAIKDGTFYKNEAFLQAIHYAHEHKSTLHVMGLLTNGQSAHAHPQHVYALLELLRRHKVERVALHLFTDGRDSSPHSAITHLRKLRKYLAPHEKIASVMGRFYAMDRNKIWSRTEIAYRALVLGKAEHTAASAEEAISAGYNRGETDEYITPTIIEKDDRPIATIGDHDAIIFFNARSDRARQLTKAFVQPQSEFNAINSGVFKRTQFPKNIRFVAMTDFGPDLPNILTAFPSPDVVHSLVSAIDERYKQLYISETEKYAHITYFINGGYSTAINGEKRELIPSGDTYSYADKPGMCSREVTSRILSHLKKQEYDFIAVNFPNVDMVGHTGDYPATCQAVKIIDGHVAQIVTAVMRQHGAVVITADHGNAEMMYDPETGAMDTEHSTSLVPFIIISASLRHHKIIKSGRLADVAPTLLRLLDIPKPKEMTSKSLIS